MWYNFHSRTDKISVDKIDIIQYSPKIMHAQEVVQEVLALQEHASRCKT